MFVKEGDIIVVSDHPEAALYTVLSVKRHELCLGYTTRIGMKVNAGWFDRSLCKAPTAEQIRNNSR